MSKQVLVAIADGTEEIEAVTVIDVLHRAGVEVTVASVDGLEVKGGHDIRITADKLIADCTAETFQMIVLPGGLPGAEHLRDSQELKQMLVRQQQEGRYIAAICASPAVVLQSIGILGNRQATCYPSFASQLANQNKAAEAVVVDGSIITSQGPGTAFLFAFTLVQILCGNELAKELAGKMLFPFNP
jgi:4-methyl-5(b-hydroxyethyl)-thiazole monophosphate biosynthesis